jgi:hypothetical protein
MRLVLERVSTAVLVLVSLGVIWAAYSIQFATADISVNMPATVIRTLVDER